MTALVLLIAASLLISAGFVMGAWWATRNGNYDDGYLQAQIDLADDAAWASTLRPEAQRHAARMGWQ